MDVKSISSGVLQLYLCINYMFWCAIFHFCAPELHRKKAIIINILTLLQLSQLHAPKLNVVTTKKIWIFNFVKVVSVAAEWHTLTPYTEFVLLLCS